MKRETQGATGAGAFEQYAAWYDAFNKSKDYSAEARYLLAQVERWVPAPRNWLDVGCGTGTHLACLAALGLSVEGVDGSAGMLAMARMAHPAIPFHLARAEDFDLPGDRDVVSMLFHVLSYQTTDTAVERTLENAAGHLAPHGVLTFDFWHSWGVLHDPPGLRVRQANLGHRTIFRIARPSEGRLLRKVDIHYEFRWDSPEGPLAHEETHSMRHFTREELESFLRRAGLEVLACEAWMKDRPLRAEDWYGLICARRESTAA